MWLEQLLGTFSNRRAHRGLPGINQVDTISCLRQFDDPHRAQLIQEISGAYQTRAQQAAWDPEVDGSCKFCPAQDDKLHRWFECPATAESRAPYQIDIDFAMENLPCLPELPCILQDPFQMFYMTLQMQMPEPVFPQDLLTKLRSWNDMGFPPVFYTDGSRLNPSSVFSRHAAFAIVVDTALYDHERVFQATKYVNTGLTPTTLHTLTTARLPGTQTIQRAELYAIVILCELFKDCCVYTDSQVALVAFRRCRVARSFACLQTLDNGDLIWRLYQAVRHGTQQVLKVKAHQLEHTYHDPVLCYHSLGNHMADVAAGKGAQFLHPSLVRDLSLRDHDLMLQKKTMVRLYGMMLEQHAGRARRSQRKEGASTCTWLY